MYDNDDFFYDFFMDHPIWTMILAVVLCSAVGIACTYAIDGYSCSSKAKMLDTDYQYGILKGCWIKDKPNGNWVDYSVRRTME